MHCSRSAFLLSGETFSQVNFLLYWYKVRQMDELSKNEAMGDLYALYGALLTQGQQDYFEDYYYNDLSLGEIADNRQVSRQAVYDNLRRSSKALEKYEAKLHLLASYNQLEEGISRALNSLLAEDQEAAKLQLEELLQVIRGE
ncbi:UPF0122 protein [Lactobacillus nasalidis]|uniref:UPF0122 protein lacNasYZ03_04500 n=2 Tax=Lactobacillus nasalidis TaxID=2797258 RepID=A0ABQ3W494_9LACO|nr:UPF0122 protein [Lactobacillus nasalidis]GHV98811.1 UPF0122 protein [Lactobacillus nasalidis]GHW00763.1 UPF0122 protein [Lactobacillus nasalidis]